ncbi:hypothetical protein DPEC_G00370330 [Dallia pectoralis]|nr:hypothetical protein DPEC_G00370330 [Dallia pectoralis]
MAGKRQRWASSSCLMMPPDQATTPSYTESSMPGTSVPWYQESMSKTPADGLGVHPRLTQVASAVSLGQVSLNAHKRTGIQRNSHKQRRVGDAGGWLYIGRAAVAHTMSWRSVLTSARLFFQVKSTWPIHCCCAVLRVPASQWGTSVLER